MLIFEKFKIDFPTYMRSIDEKKSSPAKVEANYFLMSSVECRVSSVECRVLSVEKWYRATFGKIFRNIYFSQKRLSQTLKPFSMDTKFLLTK